MTTHLVVESIRVKIPRGVTAVTVWMGTGGSTIPRGVTAATAWKGTGCLMMGAHVQVSLQHV